MLLVKSAFPVQKFVTPNIMRNVEQLLTQYAAYHRDQRNIVTHFIGVPMIVFSVVLAQAQIAIGPIHLAWISILLAGIYYVWLERTVGLVCTAFLILCGITASIISAQTTVATSLLIATGLFVAGWIIQLVGHRYEGMKPAFVDDLIGLMIGPLFVTAEIFFHFGLKRDLHDYIQARVGPTMPARDGRPIGPAGHFPKSESNNIAA